MSFACSSPAGGMLFGVSGLLLVVVVVLLLSYPVFKQEIFFVLRDYLVSSGDSLGNSTPVPLFLPLPCQQCVSGCWLSLAAGCLDPLSC